MSRNYNKGGENLIDTMKNGEKEITKICSKREKELDRKTDRQGNLN